MLKSIQTYLGIHKSKTQLKKKKFQPKNKDNNKTIKTLILWLKKHYFINKHFLWSTNTFFSFPSKEGLGQGKFQFNIIIKSSGTSYSLVILPSSGFSTLGLPTFNTKNELFTFTLKHQFSDLTFRLELLGKDSLEDSIKICVR